MQTKTKKAEEAKKAQAEEKEEEPVQEITIDDFDKIKLKVGTVIASEKMKGSKKLLKNQIKVRKRNETDSFRYFGPIILPKKW